MLVINLIGANVGVAHGVSPTGENVLGLQFIDPATEIRIQAEFSGDGLDEFLERIKRPADSGIEIVQAIPQGVPPVPKR